MTVTKNPQLEEGHIRIANELFDAVLRAKLKYSTQTVLLAVMRKTYGYGKKEDDVSASQLGELCAMSRQHVTTALNELADRNIITKKPGVYGTVVGVNKDYSKWVLGSPKQGQVSKSRTSKSMRNDSPNLGQVNESRTTLASPNLGQVDSPNLGHTKDNLPKEHIPPIPPRGEGAKKTKSQHAELPEGFLDAWRVYPKREGPNPRRDAASAWRARLREGESSERLIEATKKYASVMEADGKTGTRFIMHAARFFGKSRPYEYYLGVDDQAGSWWSLGGFDTEFDAINAGATKYNIHKFEVTA